MGNIARKLYRSQLFHTANWLVVLTLAKRFEWFNSSTKYESGILKNFEWVAPSDYRCRLWTCIWMGQPSTSTQPPASSPAASCVLWRSSVCVCVCEQRRAGPPGRLRVATPWPAWKALGQPWCLCLLVQSGQLISPIHPSPPVLPVLPVCLLQPLTLQWSQASMAQRTDTVPSGPVRTLKRGGRWTDTGGQQQTRWVFIKPSYFLPSCISVHVDKEKEVTPDRWTRAKFAWCVFQAEMYWFCWS